MSAPSNLAARGLFNSTIGAKIVMALTGFVLVGFVVQHMVANLQLYAGPDALNSYAAGLKGLGGGSVVWLGRAFLLACLGLHVAAAIKLGNRNRAARPARYAVQRFRQTTYAARFMLLTGFVVLFFIAYHIAHFTVGVVQPESFSVVDAAGRHDVWRMVVTGFRDPLTATLYVIANVAVAVHLSHSVTSMFATLGLSVGRYKPMIERIGPAVALVVLLGNISFPLTVLLGLVHL
jgi:succinate dehydrogenase / fumarate reductase cytochrome b subunit